MQAPHYDTTFVAKLLVNYRSHPAILRLPNALFYKVWGKCGRSRKNVWEGVGLCC